jgi:hypothetical protein
MVGVRKKDPYLPKQVRQEEEKMAEGKKNCEKGSRLLVTMSSAQGCRS